MAVGVWGVVLCVPGCYMVCTCNKWVAREQKFQIFTSTSFILYLSFSAHVCFPPSWSIINASDARPPCPLHTQPVLHPSHPSSPPQIIQPIRHPSPYFELFTLSGIRCLFHWCNSVGYTTLWNLLCQASPACLMIFFSLWKFFQKA